MSDAKSKQIASKWNARYAFANKQIPTPAQVLINAAEYLPKAGVAVDIACGLGGNAFHLANIGLSVHAWDLSEAAIDSIQQQSATLEPEKRPVAQLRDVVVEPPTPDSFDVIVVSRFLDRGLCRFLSDALRPNGVLFYQTFTAGLSNTDYLLGKNELPSLFPSLHSCYEFESALDEQGFSEAQYVGRKG